MVRSSPNPCERFKRMPHEKYSTLRSIEEDHKMKWKKKTKKSGNGRLYNARDSKEVDFAHCDSNQFFSYRYPHALRRPDVKESIRMITTNRCSRTLSCGTLSFHWHQSYEKEIMKIKVFNLPTYPFSFLYLEIFF